MNEQINNLKVLYNVNTEIKKFLKKEYLLNLYHLEVIHHIFKNENMCAFTVSDMKEALNINQTQLTHVISFLQQMNYCKKERTEADERKINIIVETRHRNKINPLINQLEEDVENILMHHKINKEKGMSIVYAIYIDTMISNLKTTLFQKRGITLDQFMVLILLIQKEEAYCSLKLLKVAYLWDMVKINKVVKSLVTINAVIKKRDRNDERLVLIKIKDENMIYELLEDAMSVPFDRNGYSKIAMLE